MIEHTVTVGSVGGTTTLTCTTLQISNIEYPWPKLTADGVKETILKYKYLKEEDANFDLKVVDERPEPENYNEQKDRESKDFKSKTRMTQYRNE